MSDHQPQKKRVLVCPLNWGLGHASRCIPLIRRLQLAGFEVIVAADGRALALLQTEFTEITCIRLPGFSPRFSAGAKLTGEMLMWVPLLIWHSVMEHRKLSSLVDTYKINAVISDNRFGLFTHKAVSVFITHQIMIKAPRILSFIEPMLYRINRFFIQRYDYCWIPDLPGSENLSGDLSHKYPLPLNAHFIGLLSRFSKNNKSGFTMNGPILAVLSGPEPQRTVFEALILKQLDTLNQSVIIIRGIPEHIIHAEFSTHAMMLAHMKPEELSQAIADSRLVICRTGYSSLMDMAVLGKREVLMIPTPGQTEQEYLATRLQAKGWFNVQNQRDLNMNSAILSVNKYKGIPLQAGESLLDEQIFSLNRHLEDSASSR